MENFSVSVVIPNYNYRELLRERVESILSQTYLVAEMIFLDDASSDGSVLEIQKIVEEIKESHPQIKVQTYFNKKNSGNVCRQWKRGFEMATGEIVWIAEVDDSAEKEFLENALEPFRDDEVVISYTESKIINLQGGLNLKRTVRQIFDNFGRGKYIRSGTREIQERMCVLNTIPNVSAALFRKTKIDVGILTKSAEFQIAGDWYFYEKNLLKGKIGYNPKRLNIYRIHDDSVTKTTAKKRYLEETMEMHRIIENDVELSEVMKKKMRKQEEYLARKWGIVI